MMAIKSSVDRGSIKIKDLGSSETDFHYWKKQTVEARLEALEDLRKQFMLWKYGVEQGFQRVYTIIECS